MCEVLERRASIMKQYTKKQIIEAIKHWQNVLKMLDESKSPLLDTFAKKFTEEVVFSKNGHEKIFPTLNMLKEIYHIVNDIVFDSKLIDRDIKIDYAIDVDHLKFASYVFASAKQNNKTVYVKHTYTSSNGKVFYPPYIEISDLMLHMKMPFAYIASAIVHEMIHQYTIEIGDELEIRDDDMKNKKEHDPHGNEFKSLMNEINEKYGLSIEIACDLSKIEDEFNQSVISAQRMLENENDKNKKNIIYDSEYMTIEKPSDEEIYITHIY